MNISVLHNVLTDKLTVSLLFTLCSDTNVGRLRIPIQKISGIFFVSRAKNEEEYLIIIMIKKEATSEMPQSKNLVLLQLLRLIKSCSLN